MKHYTFIISLVFAAANFANAVETPRQPSKTAHSTVSALFDKVQRVESGKYPFEIDYKNRLGGGAFGTVYSGKYKGLDVAIKVQELGSFDEKELTGIANEQRILEKLSNRCGDYYVVKYYDSFINPVENLLFIIMEQIKGENLGEYLKSMNRALLPVLAKYLVRGLDCIHNSGVVHRDVKPDNIMVSRTKKDVAKVVYIDFGLSCDLNSNVKFAAGLDPCKGSSGTTGFMPKKEYSLRSDDFSYLADTLDDHYALGATLYFLINGGRYLNYFDMPKHNVIDQFQKKDYPEIVHYIEILTTDKPETLTQLKKNLPGALGIPSTTSRSELKPLESQIPLFSKLKNSVRAFISDKFHR